MNQPLTAHASSTAELAILTYHSLDASGSVLSTSPAVFAEQMRILTEIGAEVLPLNDVLRALQQCAREQQPLVAITFDDGFRNLSENALPVLSRYGFEATVFLVTDYCGKDNSWPTQPAFVERRSLLRWSEIKEMSAAGIAFGSHTRTHANLTKVPHHIAEQEMTISKMAIEDATGRPVDALAYPYGRYDEPISKLARSHFSLACSASLGFVAAGDDPFALRRIDMYYMRCPVLFRGLFSRQVKAYLGVRNAVRKARHWI